MSVYLVVKFVHVLVAIVAVGSSAGSSLWLRLAMRNPPHLPFALRSAKFLDEFLTRPGLIVLLITGFWMATTHWSLALFWVRGALILLAIVLLLLYVVVGPLLARQQDGTLRQHHDPVAVHVDRLENALRQILFLRCRELGHQEIQEDRQLLPLGIGVRQDRGEKAVGADECLCCALEIDLLVFVHGFDNTFSDALTRAAFNREWLAASGLVGTDTTVIAFSWPSLGQVVSFPVPEADYKADKNMARNSGAALMTFFANLSPILTAARNKIRITQAQAAAANARSDGKDSSPSKSSDRSTMRASRRTSKMRRCWGPRNDETSCS